MPPLNKKKALGQLLFPSFPFLRSKSLLNQCALAQSSTPRFIALRSLALGRIKRLAQENEHYARREDRAPYPGVAFLAQAFAQELRKRGTNIPTEHCSSDPADLHC